MGDGVRLDGRFGDLGAILGRHCEQFNFRSFFCFILVAKKVPQGRLLGSKNGAKIAPKTRSKFQTEKVANKLSLGCDVGRLGVVF